MKDNELRGIVLNKFYDGRKDFAYLDISTVDFENTIPDDEIHRICKQLHEFGLIEWLGTQLRNDERVQRGCITAAGVDVVEGSIQPPISILIDQSHTVTVSGSNNIVGDNNYLSLEKVNSEISHSNFSEAEKEEAKSLWQKVCDNKILNTVISSVFGAAAKHVLESSTHPK